MQITNLWVQGHISIFPVIGPSNTRQSSQSQQMTANECKLLNTSGFRNSRMWLAGCPLRGLQTEEL